MTLPGMGERLGAPGGRQALLAPPARLACRASYPKPLPMLFPPPVAVPSALERLPPARRPRPCGQLPRDPSLLIPPGAALRGQVLALLAPG